MLVPAKCLCGPWVSGKSVLYKKIEIKVNDLIQSFIHRHKSHIISMLNIMPFNKVAFKVIACFNSGHVPFSLF